MQTRLEITHRGDVVRQIRAGEDRAQVLDLIISRYGERLYWHLRRMVVLHEEAEDALQDTFVAAYNALDGFRGESEGSLIVWLYKIATNVAIKMLRRRRRSIFVSIDAVGADLLADYEMQIAPDADEIAVRLQRAVVALPVKQKLVFNLRYYDELSFEDISQATGMSVATLKVNYHYAVKRIKEQVTIFDYEEEQ